MSLLNIEKYNYTKTLNITYTTDIICIDNYDIKIMWVKAKTHIKYLYEDLKIIFKIQNFKNINECIIKYLKDNDENITYVIWFSSDENYKYT